MLPLSSVVYPQHWPLMLLKAKVRFCFSSAQKLQFPSHFPREEPKSLAGVMKHKILRPLAPLWLHRSFCFELHRSHTGLLTILQICQACSYLRAFALTTLLPGMPHLSLILISTYMTSPRELIPYGSPRELIPNQQASSQLMVNRVCLALFLSVGLICYLFPHPDGCQSLFTG